MQHMPSMVDNQTWDSFHHTGAKLEESIEGLQIIINYPLSLDYNFISL